MMTVAEETVRAKANAAVTPGTTGAAAAFNASRALPSGFPKPKPRAKGSTPPEGHSKEATELSKTKKELEKALGAVKKSEAAKADAEKKAMVADARAEGQASAFAILGGSTHSTARSSGVSGKDQKTNGLGGWQKGKESKKVEESSGEPGLGVVGCPDRNVVLDLGATTDIMGAPHIGEATDDGPANVTVETVGGNTVAKRWVKWATGDGFAARWLGVPECPLSLVSVVPKLLARWRLLVRDKQAQLESPEGEVFGFELEDGLYRYKGRMQQKKAVAEWRQLAMAGKSNGRSEVQKLGTVELMRGLRSGTVVAEGKGKEELTPPTPGEGEASGETEGRELRRAPQESEEPSRREVPEALPQSLGSQPQEEEESEEEVEEEKEQARKGEEADQLRKELNGIAKEKKRQRGIKAAKEQEQGLSKKKASLKQADDKLGGKEKLKAGRKGWSKALGGLERVVSLALLFMIASGCGGALAEGVVQASQGPGSGSTMLGTLSQLGVMGAMQGLPDEMDPLGMLKQAWDETVGEPKRERKPRGKGRKRVQPEEQSEHEHRCNGHHPYDPNCLACVMAKIRAKAMTRRGEGDVVEDADKGYVLGLDVLGPLPCADTEGYWYVLVGVEVGHTNYGMVRRMKDKSSVSIRDAVASMVTEVETKKEGEKTIVRVHSDRGPEFEKEVAHWLLDKNIRQTDNGAYKPEGNSKVERRIGQISEVMRANMWDGAGGVADYDPLWGAATVHACDRINKTVWSDGRCPEEALTGRKKQTAEEEGMKPFASHVISFRPKERRPSKLSTPGFQAIWVGKSTMVPGGDVVIPVSWDSKNAKWELGHEIDVDKCQYREENRPLVEGTEAVPTNSRSAVKVAEMFQEKYNLMNYQVGKSKEEWRDEEGRDKIWDVAAVLDYRSKGEKGKPVYKVRWADGHETWEPMNHLDGCKQLVEDYMAKRKADKEASIAARSTKGTKLIANARKKRARARGKLAKVRGMAAGVGPWVSEEEDARAVSYLLRRQKRSGTVEEWMPGYRAEVHAVFNTRLRKVETHDEVRKAQAQAVPMRINLEPKHDGRKKCRWILQGFREPASWDGVDGNDSPVTSMASIRTIVFKNNEVEEEEVLSSVDVSTAFLQADGYGPEERVRYVSYKPYPGATTQYFQLMGPIYGQRAAPKAWFETFTKWLVSEGFEQGKNEPCTFYKKGKGSKPGLAVVVYVDDCLVRGNEQDSKEFYKKLEKKFQIKDPTYLTEQSPLQFLGFEIAMNDGFVEVDQEVAIERFLEGQQGLPAARVGSPMPSVNALHEDETPVGEEEATKFRKQCGTLNYFAVASRYDIGLAVSKLSQFSCCPTVSAVKAMKRVIQYLRAHPQLPARVKWEKGGENEFSIYSDSDHCGDKKHSTRSQTGTICFLNGAPVFWRSKKQTETAVSSAVAEIYAMSETVQSTCLLGARAEEMGVKVKWPLCVQVDNNAAISFQRSSCPQSKVLGWIDAREARVLELRDKLKIRVEKVESELNCADILTKGLPTYRFKNAMKNIRGKGEETRIFVGWVRWMKENLEE